MIRTSNYSLETVQNDDLAKRIMLFTSLQVQQLIKKFHELVLKNLSVLSNPILNIQVEELNIHDIIYQNISVEPVSLFLNTWFVYPSGQFVSTTALYENYNAFLVNYHLD